MLKIFHKSVLWLCIIILIVLALGFIGAPHDPNYVNILNKFAPPSSDYPFGTDALGRCVLSRLLYGGRTTLGVVLSGAISVSFWGILIGMLIGQNKKSKHVLADSILNAFTAIPPMALLIVFIGAWGNGILTSFIALNIALLMRVIKLVKSETEIQLEKAYVMCAIASGVPRMKLLFLEILPNIIRSVIRFVALSCGDLIMSIVAFSFIGLGFGDNIVDWGSMVSDARKVLYLSPRLILYPLISILISVLAFNLLSYELERSERVHD